LDRVFEAAVGVQAQEAGQMLRQRDVRDGPAARDASANDRDDVVVRVGGDEFVCSLNGIDLDAARERFRLVSEDLATGRDPGSISVGLNERSAGDSVDDVFNRADAALGGIKRAARARSSVTNAPCCAARVIRTASRRAWA
jgi:hypothetical protein